jgi:hypothetical protein
MTRPWSATLLAGLWLVPSHAAAAEPAPDGVYGRLDGDLDLGAGAGVEVDRSTVRGAVRLDSHYFSTVGATLGYADAFGSGQGAQRVLSVGMHLRPAFLLRWRENLERGPAFLDLTLDSVGLGLGAFFSQPRGGTFGQRIGLEATLGIALPLCGTARGLWIGANAMLRWPEADGTAAAGVVPIGLLTLEWHQLVDTGLLPE